jgi:hypothetical protein
MYSYSPYPSSPDGAASSLRPCSESAHIVHRGRWGPSEYGLRPETPASIRLETKELWMGCVQYVLFLPICSSLSLYQPTARYPRHDPPAPPFPFSPNRNPRRPTHRLSHTFVRPLHHPRLLAPTRRTSQGTRQSQEAWMGETVRRILLRFTRITRNIKLRNLSQLGRQSVDIAPRQIEEHRCQVARSCTSCDGRTVEGECIRGACARQGSRAGSRWYVCSLVRESYLFHFRAESQLRKLWSPKASSATFPAFLC